MRRGDVITVGGEDDERVSNSPKVSGTAVANSEFAIFKFIADEQVFDDRDDFLAAHEIEPVPPSFKFKKPLALRIDLGEQSGVLFPDCLFRLQILKILRKPRAIETPVTEIGGKVGQPNATEKPAGYPHRINAGFPRPIGHWRAVKHSRADQALAIRG